MSYEGRIVYTADRRADKKRPPRSGILIPLIVLLLLLLFTGGSVYLLQLPNLQIKEIKISGIETLDEESVRSVVKRQLEGSIFLLIPRSSFLFVRSPKLSEEIIRAFPRIKEIKIEKTLSDTITVNVKEREFWGILCNDLQTFDIEENNQKNEETLGVAKEVVVSVCVYIDKEGFSYEYAPNSSGSLITKIKTDYPEIKIGSMVLDGKIVERMHFLGREIKRAIGTEAVGYEFSFKIPSEIRVVTSDGFRIYFNVEDDFQNVFRVLKTILDEEIKEKRTRLQYIDVRFGNKVFYKFR